MPEGFTFFDLQMLIGVKLCFFVFVALAIWGIYRKYKPVYFVVLTAVTLAVSYYIFVSNTSLMFWGLSGDEITLAAMYYKFAQVSLFADFSYSHLPPFYPPLFFWIGGLVGRVLNWNGIQIAKFMTCASFLVYPIFLFVVQNIYWRYTKHKKHAPGAIAWMLSAILLYAVLDADTAITKPYEIISASLTALWSVFLIYDVYYRQLTWRRIFIYGITGGILFLLFYFWFFLAAIGIALFHACTKFSGRIRAWLSYIVIGIVMLLISSPFWYPLAESYRQLGAENWQAGYFLITGIGLQGFHIACTVPALVALFGFIMLIVYRKHVYMRGLLALFLSAYIWQIAGMVTLLFYASPIQESKGFYFWGTSILVIAASYGFEQLWYWLKKHRAYKIWLKPVKIIGILVIASELFFGFFTDNPVVQATRVRSRSPRVGVPELVEFLQTENTKDTTTVHSGVTELYAFVPMNDFIYYNMNNSHPAAHFSDRMLVVEDMARVQTPEELYDIARHNDIAPIDRFVLFNNTDKDVYQLYFHVDNFPQVNKEKVIKIKKELFDEKYFEKAYENDRFVVFEPVSDID